MIALPGLTLVTGRAEVAKSILLAFARQLNQGMLPNRFPDAGLGQMSEIFDGDPPHAPRGYIAQAWSVAELLHAAVEDVAQLRPGR